MLSKSKYCAFVQCPRNLWLNTYHPELASPNHSADARMEAGNEIGDLAMRLFGDFVEVTAHKGNGKMDLSEMIARTNELLKEECPVICEASFSYNGNYCAVDILKRENGGYAIYEVKSSTHANQIYAVDIAYQKYVLEHCGVNVTGTYLVCINSEYVFDGTLKLDELFQIVDLSVEVSEEFAHVEANVLAANSVMDDPVEPLYGLSEGCQKPYPCAFWQHCSSHLPAPCIFDVYKIPFAKKIEYYNDGVVTYEDVKNTKEMKNHIRSLQINHGLAELGTYVDKKGIREFLDTLSFPLYFLDFETMQLPIPRFVGTKPYAQIPFQYSLHYLESPDGELQHTEFLGVSGEDPRRALAEQLCRDIPMNVCTLAYNKGFECGRIRELAEYFPDLAEHLLNIADNIKDLIIPFRAGHYYNRAMGGSFSIKSVLPAIYPDEPSLDYHNLEGVHNGGEAMTLFPLIKDLPIEEQATARHNLLKYCELDTYAMVKVWEELVRVTC
ncbi:MAG: DUF2779 domain-containing protein [Clostridia bacterium]|nr:DUF2779 domain-containing protein [Clostridia bacterium]